MITPVIYHQVALYSSRASYDHSFDDILDIVYKSIQYPNSSSPPSETQRQQHLTMASLPLELRLLQCIHLCRKAIRRNELEPTIRSLQDVYDCLPDPIIDEFRHKVEASQHDGVTDIPKLQRDLLNVLRHIQATVLRASQHLTVPVGALEIEWSTTYPYVVEE
eukprot:PhF_6_TR25806/c0_g1_i1/m.36415